jgi:hypothetical protein
MPIKTTKVSMSDEEMEKILLDHLKLKISDPILNITLMSKDKIYVETEKPAKDIYSRKVYRKFTIEISKGWI